ncbi:MAG: sulfatase-like hydrolase/transferase [Proteobacteria bacterium]|nr:sulfatase-like hydrolase/transferase [Pseudomonadota bacterium]MDA0897099.1 sulfatase-like hydrolase/transferase [Pseudomonadota bacterium]MDA1244866.1 sulfatase-like hydrolase/transferase [Pseudomonadota bacterium]
MSERKVMRYRVHALWLLAFTWPALWSVLRMGASPLWLVSSMILAGLFAFIGIRGRLNYWLGRVGLSVFGFVVIVLNWLLAVSFYTQGTGFNDQLFFHVTPTSLGVAWGTNRLQIISQFTALAFVPVLIWVLSRPTATAPGPAFSNPVPQSKWVSVLSSATISLFFVVAVALSYPVVDLASYLVDRAAYSKAPQRANTEFIPVEGAKPKNIILIYAESLEATYFDTSLFDEDLLPGLSELKKRAKVYTDVRQRPGTGWTIAGMVASQCGFSVQVNTPFSGNTRLAASERPYDSAKCLGDVANELGYQTLAMGGATSEFAGKGNFLRAHGFDRVWGREEIIAQSAVPLELSPWGVHDDDLFNLAIAEIEKLEADEEPYFVSLLTLDTHHPDGYPAPSCAQFPSENRMDTALSCTDSQISAFIESLGKVVDMDNTVVAVFSDHLAMRNSHWSQLAANPFKRRLLFMVLNGEVAAEIDTPISHYEIGPTLLVEANAVSSINIGFGRTEESLQAEPVSSRSFQRALYAEETLDLNLFRDKLTVDEEDLRITLGDSDFYITENGGTFVYGVYMPLFDDEGQYLDVLYARSLDDVLPQMRGKLVAYFVRETRESDQIFTVGRLSEDPNTSRSYSEFGALEFTQISRSEFSD